ncbi:TlpA family protein disulfide reductase [Silvibacterium dinghuense]|uniref:TlpA family protein disulfide reductase n=1 Tax=Silvibacterium dinghuense TaxID=1560006 RepID=A0A4Q1SJ24_9BACT|nr:TlpA disulfide reductase family protein [Silvibacterium dinghuense]RXS97423.1 TlpA family protein disulfide reductase [Silvibacterium dinghuense]
MGKLLKRVVLVLAVLVVAVAAVAWAGFRFVEARIAAKMEPPRLVAEPEPASDLAYRTLDGQPQQLSSARGKVVFVDLWGTWCIQCVAEMPTVQKLYEHYRNDAQVQFLVISRLDSPASVRRYAQRNHYTLPFYVMEDDDIPASMRLNQYPSTFLYAKDGTLVAKHTGAADWSAPGVIAFIDGLKAR